MVIEHDSQRRQQLCIVLQGLTHAHHHHVGDHALVTPQMLTQEVLCKPQLGNDLAGTQVTAEALVPRRAKTTAHGATCLRRNTQSAAVGLRDKDSFNDIAGTHIKQPFDGAVSRVVPRHDTQTLNMRFAGELAAQRLGQVSHIREVAGATLVNPTKKLSGAVTLFPQLFAVSGQRVEVKIEQVHAHVFLRPA